MTDIALNCDMLATAVEAIVRPRAERVQDLMNSAGLPFPSAYLKLRFEELGARVSVVSDVTGHSREHLYLVMSGARPLSNAAAVAITKAFPDITMAELMAINAIRFIQESADD